MVVSVVGGGEAYRTWPSFSCCRSNFKQCCVAWSTYPFSRQAIMAFTLAPRTAESPAPSTRIAPGFRVA